MNTKQKLLSFFLAIIMVITLLPNPTFADGETGTEPPKAADGYYLLDSPEDLYWFYVPVIFSLAAGKRCFILLS